ncbi:S49 family peptidase [Haematobacter massiliensis]|uniref:S49 family peptidase n=1 Tax=Haematobacter massiliensis TaxID=195105 RepID=UPI0023F4D907|nr:S49 family peptidase [Haematobacter massiliensis]
MTTIAAMIGAAPVALSQAHAACELLAELPQAAAPGGQVAAAGMPERYAVSGGVAFVPVRGLLTPNSAAFERWFGWSTYQGLTETAEALAADQGVSAVVLDLDTPGGFVIGVDGAAEALAQLAAVKPVHALVSPLAASAGYWLASQATDVTMTPGAWVGSIGVAVLSSAYVGPGSGGAQYFQFTSSNARAKLPDPATEEGRAEIMRNLDAGEARFHAAVARGRNIPVADLPGRLTATDDVRDGGAVWTGAEAISRGLADRVATRAGFMAEISQKYGRSGGTAGGRRASIARQAQAEAARALAAI